MAQTDEPRVHTRPAGEHLVYVEPSPRWVRGVVDGQTVVDSRRALLLLETNHLPVYYFPPEDVRQDLLTPTDLSTRCPYKGQASYWTLKVGDRVLENAVWSYQDPLPERQDIRGYQAFYWNKVDAWFEEAEQVYAHPRDPYHRVDALPSSRHVRVEIGGVTVAETNRPHLLFETGLPTRYYIPREDVRMDLLVPTATSTRCPYKGQASYWKLADGGLEGRDVAWAYLDPIPQCPAIRGLLAFFNERFDAIHVDGEPQPRPKTKWS